MIGCPLDTTFVEMRRAETSDMSNDEQAKSIFDQTSMAGCFMLKPDSVPWL